MATQRVTWLDYAKAISITLVVMMHSVRGVGDAMGGVGFMHAFVDFTDPFRIPTFFLLAGLLVPRAVEKSWAVLWDRKVLFYVYFYVLWTFIQFAFKAPLSLPNFELLTIAHALGLAFANPDTTLWFIAVLPVYFVIAKSTKDAPAWLVLGAAFVLLAAPIDTSWRLLDYGSNGLFYFVLGQRAAPYIFATADELRGNGMGAVGFLAAWAVVAMATLSLSAAPGLSALFALLGGAAVIAISVLLERAPAMAWLRWVGRNTLVIYLAFFLPMAVTRIVLVKLGIFEEVGVVSLIVWLAAMIGPVSMYFTTRRVGFGRFLFERPQWASLASRHRPLTQAAE
ncbi:MAG: acyltransferase family protein [Pseudomonadota bacterium]